MSFQHAANDTMVPESINDHNDNDDIRVLQLMVNVNFDTWIHSDTLTIQEFSSKWSSFKQTRRRNFAAHCLHSVWADSGLSYNKGAVYLEGC